MTLNQRTMNKLGKRGDQTASADSILGLDLGLGEQGRTEEEEKEEAPKSTAINRLTVPSQKVLRRRKKRSTKIVLQENSTFGSPFHTSLKKCNNSPSSGFITKKITTQ